MLIVQLEMSQYYLASFSSSDSFPRVEALRLTKVACLFKGLLVVCEHRLTIFENFGGILFGRIKKIKKNSSVPILGSMSNKLVSEVLDRN